MTLSLKKQFHFHQSCETLPTTLEIVFHTKHSQICRIANF